MQNSRKVCWPDERDLEVLFVVKGGVAALTTRHFMFIELTVGMVRSLGQEINAVLF